MRWLVVVGVLMLAAPAAALEPPDPAAAAAVAALEKATDIEKSSAAFQAKLARAYLAASDMEKMADAALLARLASGNTPPADLTELQKFLPDHAKSFHDEAMKHLTAKDLKSAVKAYLQAVKRDPAIVGREDGGLRTTAFEALKRSAQKTPDAPHRWKLALYAYLFGELETADAELKALASAPPEMRWRVAVLVGRVGSELHAQRAADAAARAAAATARKVAPAAGGADPLPEPSMAGEPPADPNAARRSELQIELEKTDRLITYYSNPEGYKYNIDDTGDSRVVKFSSSGPRLQEKIEGLKARKAQLELELSNLR